MTELGKKFDEMNYDSLISDVVPKIQIRGGVIRKLSAEETYLRGTILAKSSVDEKLVILGTTAESGETLTPDCILCDDTVIGSAEDVPVTVYTAGCFNNEKIKVKDDYTVTVSDFDALRKYSIVFKAAAE